MKLSNRLEMLRRDVEDKIDHAEAAIPLKTTMPERGSPRGGGGGVECMHGVYMLAFALAVVVLQRLPPAKERM